MTIPTGDNGIPIVDEEMRRLLSQFRAEMRPLEELQEDLSSMRGQGEAAGGHVKAEVLPSGVLTGLKIDPRALRLGADALAEAILDATRMAAGDVTARVADKMTDAMSPFVEDSRRFFEELS